MVTFINAGGFIAWIVLLFGVITLITSLIYALKSSEKYYYLTKNMSTCTVFASLSGLCSGFAAVMYHVPANPEWANSPKLHLIIMQGLGESLSSPILGFSILSVCWLIIAVGRRRQSI